MKKIILLFIAVIVVSTMTMAQEGMDSAAKIAEYKAEIAAKKTVFDAKSAEAATLGGEMKALQSKIDLISGWRYNFGGVLGFKLDGFDNWSKQANPNSKSSNISGAFGATAILERPNYFWRNNGDINIAWQQLILNTENGDLTEEEKKYNNIADVFKVTSLFGYKINKDIAASALGQYSSSIVNNFNNPGILDIGAGATWTPHQVPNLVVTVHPLNYHIVFLDGDTDTQSALGTKVFISYFAEIVKGVKWKTELNGFLEYGSSDPSLNEYTWDNLLALPAWKGIGIGVGFGLRNAAVESADMQTYYNVGLSYNL